MKQGKEDRRVRLTKLAIRDSLVELIQRLPISKISVKMICETADINRSTFYAHYTDQYDLLRSVQREVVAEIEEQIVGKRFTEKADLAVPVLAQILEFAQANSALYKVLLSENGDDSLRGQLMFLARQKSIQEIRAEKRIDKRTSAYLEDFAISGCVSVIRKWLDDGCPEKPEKLAELITKLLFQGVSWSFQ